MRGFRKSIFSKEFINQLKLLHQDITSSKNNNCSNWRDNIGEHIIVKRLRQDIRNIFDHCKMEDSLKKANTDNSDTRINSLFNFVEKFIIDDISDDANKNDEKFYEGNLVVSSVSQLNGVRVEIFTKGLMVDQMELKSSDNRQSRNLPFKTSQSEERLRFRMHSSHEDILSPPSCEDSNSMENSEHIQIDVSLDYSEIYETDSEDLSRKPQPFKENYVEISKKLEQQNVLIDQLECRFAAINLERGEVNKICEVINKQLGSMRKYLSSHFGKIEEIVILDVSTHTDSKQYLNHILAEIIVCTKLMHAIISILEEKHSNLQTRLEEFGSKSSDTPKLMGDIACHKTEIINEIRCLNSDLYSGNTFAVQQLASVLNDMNEKLQKSLTKIKDLYSEVWVANEEKNKLNQENLTLAKELENLKGSLKKSSRIYNVLKKKIHSQSEEIVDLKSKLQPGNYSRSIQEDLEMEKIKKNNEALKTIKDEMEEKFNRIETMIRTLTNNHGVNIELDNIINKEGITGLESRIMGLYAENSEILKENVKIYKELATIRQSKETILKQMRSKQGKFHNEVMDQLQDQVTKLMKETEGAQNLTAEMKKHYQNNVNTLKEEFGKDTVKQANLTQCYLGKVQILEQANESLENEKLQLLAHSEKKDERIIQLNCKCDQVIREVLKYKEINAGQITKIESLEKRVKDSSNKSNIFALEKLKHRRNIIYDRTRKLCNEKL